MATKVKRPLCKLAKHIKAFQKRSGWTNTKIGAELNVSESTVSKWLSGEHRIRPLYSIGIRVMLENYEHEMEVSKGD